MPETRPRKLPRQPRSQATFDALVEGCARLLRKHDYHAISTNHIAAKAGVSIGSLYEFFPGKEAIVAVLLERRLARLLGEVGAALEVARELEPRDAISVLIRRIVDAVRADRELYRLVFREASPLQHLPQTRQARAAFFELARVSSERAHARLDLPALEADTWLIGRMVANAVLEIAFADERGVDRVLLTDELARLTFRMIHARDPDAAPLAGRRAR